MEPIMNLGLKFKKGTAGSPNHRRKPIWWLNQWIHLLGNGNCPRLFVKFIQNNIYISLYKNYIKFIWNHIYILNMFSYVCIIPYTVYSDRVFIICHRQICRNLLWIEEILYQLIGGLFHYLQGFNHPRWCRISSTHSMCSVPFGYYIVMEYVQLCSIGKS